ncbi:22038_t:CDS:1, partial [Dentiscutata erythropus]
NKIIEKPIKKTIQEFNRTAAFYKWRMQNRTANSISKRKSHNINWHLIQKTNYLSTLYQNFNSFEDTRQRLFKLRLQNNELPTMDKLHQRRSHLYVTNKCPFCNQEKETNKHVFTCIALDEQYNIDTILKETLQLTAKQIKLKGKKNTKHMTLDLIKQTISQEPAFLLETNTISNESAEI